MTITKHGVFLSLFQSYIAVKWQNWNSNLDNLNMASRHPTLHKHHGFTVEESKTLWNGRVKWFKPTSGQTNNAPDIWGKTFLVEEPHVILYRGACGLHLERACPCIHECALVCLYTFFLHVKKNGIISVSLFLLHVPSPKHAHKYHLQHVKQILPLTLLVCYLLLKYVWLCAA